jgi:hypothetical protein
VKAFLLTGSPENRKPLFRGVWGNFGGGGGSRTGKHLKLLTARSPWFFLYIHANHQSICTTHDTPQSSHASL